MVVIVRQTHIAVNAKCARGNLDAGYTSAQCAEMVTRIHSQRVDPARRFFKDWRKHRGITQTQLAERIGELLNNDAIDHTRISKIERGVESATEAMMFAWADALQIEPGWLFVHPDVIMRERRVMDMLANQSDEVIDSVIQTVKLLSKAN
jgi:transcriptional regulator with XRE-family HTH domain